MQQLAERLSPVSASLVNSSRGIATSTIRRSDEDKAAEEKAAAEAAAKAAAEKAAAEKAAVANAAAEATAIANMRDPIQELFLTSIRAYGSSGGLAAADAAAQDALKAG